MKYTIKVTLHFVSVISSASVDTPCMSQYHFAFKLVADLFLFPIIFFSFWNLQYWKDKCVSFENFSARSMHFDEQLNSFHVSIWSPPVYDLSAKRFSGSLSRKNSCDCVFQMVRLSWIHFFPFIQRFVWNIQVGQFATQWISVDTPTLTVTEGKNLTTCLISFPNPSVCCSLNHNFNA